MTEDGRSPPRSLIRAVRLATATAAALLFVLAALDPSRRVLFGVVGGAMVVPAVFTASLLRRHAGIALLTFNTLLLLFAIEVASAGVLSLIQQPITKRVLAHLLGEPNDLIEQHYLGLPYYRREPWARQYWEELREALGKTYHPYVIWHSPAATGETLNIDERGRRVTPGAECTDDALKVFVFGGSAIWGWGAPDWGTIPGFLQRQLVEATDRPVCVTNFGENAYVSTQGFIQLYLELQASNVPDLVLFYDGVNEVLAAHQTGKPVIHQNLMEIAELFSREQAHDKPLRRLNTFQLLEQVRARLFPSQASVRPSPIDIDRLSEEIIAAYLEVYRIVASLAALHDFDYAFFWQPHILAGNKQLSPEESDMITGLDWVLEMDDELTGLFDATYRRLGAEAVQEERLFDLTNVFDEIPTQLWIDTWGHVTPEGNEIIAAAMVDALQSQ